MAGKNTPPGPAVDASGQTVIDPTVNVKALVDASERRTDDLREMESTHVREILALRAAYDEKLRLAESARIDAIRAVDVGNVATANAAAETRATTLAAQVTAAKDAQAVALKAETDPFRKDIGDLRQSQWTIAGNREQVTETRAKNGNWPVWTGIGVALFGIFASGFMVTVGLVVSVLIFLANRP